MPLRSAISSVPQWWIVCALCSWAFAVLGIKSACKEMIRIIVVSMRGNKVIPAGVCPFLYSISSWEKRELSFQLPDFYWFSKTLESGDNAFYLGLILTAVPAGVLSDLGYTKYVLGVGLLFEVARYSLLTAFDNSEIMFVVLSVVEGIGDGSVIPAVVSTISRWPPPMKRNTFAAVLMAGFFFGRAVGYCFFKLIYHSWSLGHRVIGTFALVPAVLCFVFVYSSPDESPFVTRRFHRDRSLADLLQGTRGIPWRKTITSPHFLSLVLVYCSLCWAVIVNVYEHRYSYQKYVLHLPVNQGGRVAEFLVVLPSLLTGGFLADWIIKQELASKTIVARVFVSISVICPSVSLAAAYFLVGCNVTLFWTLSITAAYTIGLGFSVIISALADLSPRHSGLQMGIMTGARSICALFDLNISRHLIPDKYNSSLYRNKLMIFTVLAFATMIPFLIFGTGEASLARRRAPELSVLSQPHTQIPSLDRPNSRNHLDDSVKGLGRRFI